MLGVGSPSKGTANSTGIPLPHKRKVFFPASAPIPASGIEQHAGQSQRFADSGELRQATLLSAGLNS